MKRRALFQTNCWKFGSRWAISLFSMSLVLGLSIGYRGKSINRRIFIGKMPEGKTYSSTMFEFRYGHQTRIVKDPHNKMQWIYGELPDSVSVHQGKRLVIYNSPGAVIKSNSDSMDVQYDSLKHGGYMGVWSEESHFIVDQNGMINRN